MSNLNLYDIYNQKRRTFGVNDSSTFQESFVEAVNLAYSEFNAEVFGAATLEPIISFDDVIDNRLDTFTSIAFDSSSEALMGDREFWAVEYSLERKSDTNSLVDLISDDNSNVRIAISNGTLQLIGDSLTFTVELPDVDNLRLLISSNKSGYRVLCNDEETADYDAGIDLDDIPDLDWIPDLELVPTETLGDSTTSQAIGTVTSRVINTVTGWSLRGTAFYSAKTKLFNFKMNEGTGSTLTDSINSYTATVTGGTWNVAYIEDSCTLDKRYHMSFSMALDFHLQNGGVWGIEPDDARERKWYGRGVKMAREVYRQLSTYSNPLGL